MRMTPLHESAGPSSPLAPGPGTAAAKRARGDRRRRGRRLTNLAAAVVGVGCLLLLPRPSAAVREQQEQEQQQQQQQQQQQEPRRGLNQMDGVTSCAGCEGPDFVCSGRTIEDDNCAPCVTGQTWWPCNIVDECYCKDLAAVAAAEAAAALAKEEAKAGVSKCDLPLCQPGETGPRLVPFTDCEEYVTCDNGVAGESQKCSPGLFFSESIQACNVLSMVKCPPDPTCPPTKTPTTSPTTPAPTDPPTDPPPPTPSPVTAEPTEPPGAPAGDAAGAPPDDAAMPPQRTAEPPGPDPAVLEGMRVMDAHVAANKIAIARELLTSPGGGGRGPNDFSYLGFRDSLRTMITVGAANRTFYVGHAAPGGNGRAYGLVNVAAFLAMSVEDSVAHGSCDEVNRDVTQGGLLPISNACGQGGRDYQAMTCPPGEERYQCAVDPAMRARANEVVDAGGRNKRGGGGAGGDAGGAPSKPFYCGPLSDYDGYTGHWDYVSQTESPHPPVENGSGRRDVEGCCWWGRGSIQLRGLCAYGKLNYYLGKRAHDEGRPSMFPDVDFCADPQAVCSHPNYPDLKWIAGMFRWITDVQPYVGGDFNYMQRLMDFVDGGLRDWTFVHGLSGIVAQGCHDPPCAAGAEFEDGARRKATFIRTLRLLGLSPGKEGTTARAAAAPAAGRRRLGESSNR